MNQAKPFEIPKEALLESWKRIKQNKGTYGVDEVSIQDFEKNLKKNLYKIWNRMSSGSYIPPAVRQVGIPKKDGTTRPLGIPTVGDRIAQDVVKSLLEMKVEHIFHPDSYGYRPGKSPHQALDTARRRCWQDDWVLDVDIKGLFDNLDHGLLMRAVCRHTQSRWERLYIERWLKAPVQLEDGTLKPRDKGTPQGGVISPLLSNLFLHYAFDEWMRRLCPSIPFERFADDIVIHCKSQKQALMLKGKLAERLAKCHLELHPEKTKIVYCKDGDRQEPHQETQFDFLGYTFRLRQVKNQKTGRIFCSFTPAVSKAATKKMCAYARSLHLRRQSRRELGEIADFINPVTRGWINYYGKYYKSALRPAFKHLDKHLARWATQKYKSLRQRPKRARLWLARIAKKNPTLFAHWKIVYPTAYGLQTIRAV